MSTIAWAGEEPEANRRTEALSGYGNSSSDNNEQQQFQDETRPVSTPGSGVNVTDAERDLDELQERLREKQRK